MMTHLALHHPSELRRTRGFLREKDLELSDPEFLPLCFQLDKIVTARSGADPPIVVIP